MRSGAGGDSVALELHDDEVRLAIVSAAAGGYSVRCHRQALPPGAVRSHAIVDAGAVATALRALLSAANVRPRQASLVLGGVHTVCRIERIPDGEDAGALAARAERMRRYVLFRGEPVLLAQAVQRDPEGLRGCAWLLNTATLREPLVEQIALAKQCGMTIVRAEPAMAALARALLDGGRSRAPRFVLLVDGEACEIAAARPDGIVYCERLKVGAAALASDGHHLLGTLEQITDYHLRHAQGQAPIRELLCAGAGEGLEGLLGRLNGADMRAEWADPAQFPGVLGVEGDGVSSPAERAALAPVVAEAFAEAAGAARRSSVNLFPSAERAGRFRLFAPWLVAALLAVVMLWGGLTVWQQLVSRRAARLTRLLSRPTAGMVETSRLQREESRLKQRCADIERLLGILPDRAVEDFVAELPRRLHKDVWLDRLDVAASGRCVLRGKARAGPAVESLAESLRQSPFVDAVRLGALSHDERLGGLILSSFVLELTLAKRRPPAAKGDTK